MTVFVSGRSMKKSSVSRAKFGVAHPVFEILAHRSARGRAERPLRHLVAGRPQRAILRGSPDLLGMALKVEVQRPRHPVNDAETARLCVGGFRAEPGEWCVRPADVVAVVVVRPDHRNYRPMYRNVADDFARFVVAELWSAVEGVVVQAEFHVEQPLRKLCQSNTMRSRTSGVLDNAQSSNENGFVRASGRVLHER